MKKLVILFLVLSSWVSAAEMSQVEKVLTEIATSKETGRTWKINEGELNQYIEEQLRRNKREGINSAEVELQEGSFLLTLDVAADKMNLGGNSSAAAIIRSLFKGNQIVQLEGTIEATKGEVTYRTTGAKINSIPVPVAVVDSLLTQLGSSVEPPFDPAKPYPLPTGLQQVTLIADNAILKN